MADVMAIVGLLTLAARRIALADVMAIVGLLTLAAGLYLIYPPAALIAIGVVLLALGIVGSR